jgi:uncharacterized delta-60 repeat protein
MGLVAGVAVALALVGAPATAGASVGNFGMAVQPDGKIVVAGGDGLAPAGGKEFGAVARYLPSGELDRSFGGGDGVVLVHGQRPFTAVALQENGRILLTSPLGGEAGLTRLLPNGALDRGFGEGGVLYGGASTAWYPTSVAVAKDGGIFTGGMTGYLNDPGEHWYGWLYRITPSGRSGDRWAGMTSGADDQPKTTINDFVFGPGGSVISAGTIAERGQGTREHAVLARLLPWSVEPGSVPTGADPSFGGGAGLVQSSFFPASTLPEAANALSWQGRRLLIAGEANGDLLVGRYSKEGLRDYSFGRHGFWTVSAGRASTDVANALAVDRKGGIFAAGSSTHSCGGAVCTSLLVAHLGRSGRPVKRWGRGGIVTPSIGSGASGQPAFEAAYDVALRSQGRILVGGLAGGPGSSRFFLRRYLADGRPDPSFGDHGRVTTLPARVAGAHGTS